MLRNSLLPTIAVVATQVGYLIGGLLVIEKLFNYNGIGLRIYTAAQNKDFPMLQSGVLVVGIVYLVATLVADILYSRPEPPDPLRGDRMSAPTVRRDARRRRSPAAQRSATATERAARDAASGARRAFILGAVIVGFWVFCAIFGDRLAPARPARPDADQSSCRAVVGALVRHRPARARRLLARPRRRARHPHRRAARDAARRRPRHRRSAWSPATSAGIVDDVISRVMDAVLALPLIVIAVLVARRRSAAVDMRR